MSQPAMRAFTVIKRKAQSDYWLTIGAAFAHEQGDGYTIILQAMPIPDGDGVCKIVLRPPTDDDDRRDDRRQQTNNDRDNTSGSRRR